MSYQTKIEICVKVTGFALAGLTALLLAVVARHIEPTAAGVLVLIGGVCLSVVAIHHGMNLAREWAGL